MENNYIIDLKGCYLPTVNDWTGLLECIKQVKTRSIDLDNLSVLFPSLYCVIYRGNQLVITHNGFFAHIYKEEVSGYVICKITDTKQIPHLECDKEYNAMIENHGYQVEVRMEFSIDGLIFHGFYFWQGNRKGEKEGLVKDYEAEMQDTKNLDYRITRC